MQVKHTLQAHAICPVDKKKDTYELIVETSSVIPVEKILEKVEQLKDETMYQEDLTVELARHLCVKVTTIGYHSGVKSEVVCNG